MKSYMSFRLVQKSVTLNDVERRNGRYFALFQRIWVPSGRTALKFTFAISSPDEFLFSVLGLYLARLAVGCFFVQFARCQQLLATVIVAVCVCDDVPISQYPLVTFAFIIEQNLKKRDCHWMRLNLFQISVTIKKLSQQMYHVDARYHLRLSRRTRCRDDGPS